MLHFSRFTAIIGAPLTLVALLGCITPAGAKLSVNKLSVNGVAQSGVSASARITTGSVLGDLNGVAVEAIIIPETAIR